MYTGLLHAHSGLRWIVLVLLVWALIKAISGWTGKKEFQKLPSLLALIFTHIQLLIGLFLYFKSSNVSFQSGVMESSVLRFYTVEHILMMIIAIGLITFGFSSAKRLEAALAKHKRISITYGLGLLIILASIPWPFRGLGTGWF